MLLEVWSEQITAWQTENTPRQALLKASVVTVISVSIQDEYVCVCACQKKIVQFSLNLTRVFLLAGKHVRKKLKGKEKSKENQTEYNGGMDKKNLLSATNKKKKKERNSIFCAVNPCVLNFF